MSPIVRQRLENIVKMTSATSPIGRMAREALDALLTSSYTPTGSTAHPEPLSITYSDAELRRAEKKS